MPNVAVGMILQSRLEWEMYGQKDLTVWHWRVNDTDAGIDLFEYLLNGLNEWLLSPTGAVLTMLNQLSADINLAGLVSQAVRPTRYRGIRTVVNVTGGDASVAGTNNVAASIGWGGDIAGRGRSGRSQIPGLPKKYQLAAKWDTAPVDAIKSALANVRVGPQTPPGFAVQLTPVLFNPRTGTQQTITTAEAHYTVRTMRRRTFGVGQ